MRARWLWGACCLLGLASPAMAQEMDARHWLERMVSAAHKLSYSGTFVFQNAALSETSRIVHRVDAGRERERIEVLDGSAREVIRSNDEVKCYLPDSHTLIIEKRSQQRSFPALSQIALASLGEYYIVRTGPTGRVADRETQVIMLDPKDELRYGRQYWADVRSGLLLKSALLNERGEAIESFAFTQLLIGGNIPAEALQSRYAAEGGNWTVRNVQATRSRAEDAAWLFKVQLPGFTKRAGMLRAARDDQPESMHFLFSDGLATISVFIESLGGNPPYNDVGMLAMGATNVYRRILGDYLLVLMGEVPQATLKRFGDGIEARKK